MKFDASRLSVLAGISQKGSGLLSEGKYTEIDSLDEIAEMEDEAHHATDEGEDDVLDDPEDDADSEDKLQELGNRRKRDEMGDEDEGGHQLAEDTVFEIDGKMLREEILRMRRERSQSLAESKLRSAIRSQIREVMLDSILKEDDDIDLNYGSDWVYGNNKPTKSKKGQIARGGFSIGFE